MKNIEEQLITPETIKLAREKGFVYIKTKYLFGSKIGVLTKEEESIPTQALLQKWLRETHNIMVYITPYMYKNPNGEYKVTLFRLTDNFRLESYDGFDTYEKALELGLQKALEFSIPIK